MKKRYKEIVIEAGKDVSFQVSKKEDEKIIRKTVSRSFNFLKPYVPKGYFHVCGDWFNGFVIERGYDGSQFVWIPVGYLKPNGTTGGNKFSSQFGRRNFLKDNFSVKNGYHEDLSLDLIDQLASVRKYGGFYISRYHISKSKRGNPQSKKDRMPWINIEFEKAKEMAASFETGSFATSHLTLGSEYDTMLEWVIESGSKTSDEVLQDSNSWGHIWFPHQMHKGILKAGVCKSGSVNNISDLSGNVKEYTQEKFGQENSFVVRGNSYTNANSVAYRGKTYQDSLQKEEETGYRIVLTLK